MANLSGTGGNDTIVGTTGSDVINSKGGNDLVIGQAGDDNLRGKSGADILSGKAGRDSLDGGGGSDTLFGGDDNDSLSGGKGNDTLFGGRGVDVLVGGRGKDIFALAAGHSAADVISDFEVGSDKIGLTGGLGFADLTIADGGTADSTISVTETGEILAIVTGIGENELADDDFAALEEVLPPEPLQLSILGAGTVTEGQVAQFSVNLDQPASEDVTVRLSLGQPNDSAFLDADYEELTPLEIVISAGQISHQVTVQTLPDDRIEGLEAFTIAVTEIETASSTINVNDVTGIGLIEDEDSDPLINGSAGNDILFGLSGTDTINGFEGNDVIDGHRGNDSLSGGPGNDTLRGSLGDDLTEGGAGNDSYTYTLGDGNDIISDSGGLDTLLFGNSPPLVIPLSDGSKPVQVSPDPLPGTITKSGLAVELVDFVQVPASDGGSPARTSQLFHADDGSGRLFVNDSRGKIWVIEDGAILPQPFLDVAAVLGNAFLGASNPQGLRSFAFHPDFENQGTPGFGKVYTTITVTVASAADHPATEVFAGSFVTGGLSHHDVLMEWTVDPNNLNAIDPASGREILRIEQPLAGHNADQLGFNPNARPGDGDYGLLYIGVGDGGPLGLVPDPNQEGQDTSTPLGSILRIDPLQNGAEAYSVPADNPFLGNPAVLPEIWAFGLRNPQKFSWDTGGNGTMLIADIGERYIEEINIGVPGSNYGWSAREGTFVLTPANVADLFALPPDDANFGFTYPAAQFDHDDQVTAVIGGFVYRGNQIPDLQGKYVFGDIVSGRIYYADVDELVPGGQATIHELTLIMNGVETTLLEVLGNAPRADLRFGQGEDGEIYVLTKRDGMVRTLAPNDGAFRPDPITEVVRDGDDLVIRFTDGGSVRVDGHFYAAGQALETLEDTATGQTLSIRTDLGFSADNDLIVGTDAAETLAGGDGNDRIHGNGGSDSLLGEVGDDILSGGPGNDSIAGGPGADLLTGGGGNDLFLLAPGDGGPNAAAADVIRDFEVGLDRIGLTGGLLPGALLIDDGGTPNTSIADAASGEVLAVLSGVSEDQVTPTSFVILGTSPPLVSVTDPPAAIEGASISFTLTVDQAVGENVLVGFAVGAAGDSATDGPDYKPPAPLEATILAGTTSADVEVATLTDSLVDGTETFSFEITTVAGAGAVIDVTQATATGTILDDPPPLVSIVAPAPATEGEILTFTISLDQVLANDVTVDFLLGVAGDSADNGLDYTPPAPPQATITAGLTFVEVAVATLIDGLIEGTESFTFALIGASGGGAAIDPAKASATGSILDADASASIDGDESDNVLIGTPENDVINGFGGNDILDGLGGADEMFAGPGDDQIFADPSDLVIDGGPGQDRVDFSDPAQIGVALDLTARGIEEARGDRGDDSFSAAGATVGTKQHGKGGDDALTGGEGKDDLRGGGGDDLLIGNGEADKLRGGSGNDTLSGGAGSDHLDGDKGDDTLVGGLGDDRLIGDQGENILSGGPGADQFTFTTKAFTDAGTGRPDLITDFDPAQSDRLDLADLINDTDAVQLVFDSPGNPGDTELFVTVTGEVTLLAVIESVDLTIEPIESLVIVA